MLRAIKYRWKIYKLNKESEKIENNYKKLKKTAKGDEYQSLHAEEGDEILPILEEVNSLRTKYFCRYANKLLVPRPDYQNKDFWQDRYYGYGRNLTDKGFWELKKLIRQDKRERREGCVVWLAALTGIIGAATGLAAVLSR